MTDEERYRLACERVQAGLAILQNFEPRMFTPKHMRVGVDLRAADAGGLATLLIEKGVFTRAEYVKAMADAAELEVANLQARVKRYAPGAVLGGTLDTVTRGDA